MDKTPGQDIINKYGIKPNKRLGQNFLVNTKILSTILETANLSGADTILEVGPGLGILTQELAKQAGKVIAVEKDLNMVAILQEVLKDYKNVEIVQADILDYTLEIESYKIVANIPYYLTSPLIRKFLE